MGDNCPHVACGDYKRAILGYIRDRHSQLAPLCEGIYLRGDRGYWEALNTRLAEFARSRGLRYVRDDDSFEQPFDAPPTVVNFFYHEEVKKSAKRASGKAAEKAGEGFAG